MVSWEEPEEVGTGPSQHLYLPFYLDLPLTVSIVPSCDIALPSPCEPDAGPSVLLTCYSAWGGVDLILISCGTRESPRGTINPTELGKGNHATPVLASTAGQSLSSHGSCVLWESRKDR